MPDEPIISDDDYLPLDLSEADPDYDPTEEIEGTQFEEEEPAPRASDELLRFIARKRLLTVEGLFNQPPIDWFIEGLLPQVPRTMLAGEGGSYKSFLMLDWMLCAATQRSWFGRDVKPGKVLYMAGEGARGLPKRIDAWCAHNHTTVDSLRNKIDFMAEPFELGTMDAKTADIWSQFVAHLGYKYIVIDTLHTASAGAEENSNTDMGKVLANATRLAGGPDGACLMFIHHKPKNAATGGYAAPRGASALRDDFDVSVGLKVAGAKGSKVACLFPDKIRDATPFQDLYILFAEHEGDGRHGSSLYIEEIDHNKEALGTDEQLDTLNKRETAVDRCARAIIEHSLNFHINGARVIMGQLADLDLGLDFKRSTVGDAITRLRGAEQQLHDMLVDDTGDDDASSD